MSMKFEVRHTGKRYLRVRLSKNRLTSDEAYNIERYLDGREELNIRKVTVNERPAGIIIEHKGDNETILNFLSSMNISDIKSEEIPDDGLIHSKKELYKRMSPALRKEFRREIMFESMADCILPEPFGTGYHLFKLASLGID